MERYTGPVEKLDRREGVSLDLEGQAAAARQGRAGAAWSRAAGQHGAARRRARASSTGESPPQARDDRQARQFVVHGHVEVDGRRLDIPSARVADGARVQIEGAPVAALAHEAAADLGGVLRAPQRDEIAMPVTEQLVIERYARR